jgi:hypothetical protein
VTLHAVQVLPALALLSLLAGATERRSLRVVAVGTAGYLALIAATMVQTYGGRGPLDLGLATTVLAALGLALLAASALDAVANALPLRSAAVPRVRGPQ